MDASTESTPLPEITISDFCAYVEWMLDIELNLAQQAEIRKILDEEWAEGDRETMALVEANLATFRVLRTRSDTFRDQWRRENQPAFVASLETHSSSELGTALLETHRETHPASAPSPVQNRVSAGATAKGVLGLMGAVALAALANREQTKREIDHVVDRDGGKSVADSIVGAMEAGRREVEELRERDPVAAAARAIENNRMNQELVNSWLNMNSNVTKVIGANMVGDSWKWT